MILWSLSISSQLSAVTSVMNISQDFFKNFARPFWNHYAQKLFDEVN
jgi:hypothetical protein